MSAPFNKVCIMGVGLIGGSLALALKKKKIAKTVVGVSRHSAARAKTLGVIDESYTLENLDQAFKDADLIVLAMPVAQNESFLKDTKITALFNPSAMIIDVGSTKATIGAIADKQSWGSRFVGCHPMAGSEKAGVEYATADIFDHSICYLMEPKANNRASFDRIENLWKQLGSTPITKDPVTHDAWMAMLSHGPHALAFAMFQSSILNLPESIKLNPSIKSYARLAKSDPEVWMQIFTSNKKNVFSYLEQYSKQLSKLSNLLSAPNYDEAAVKNFIAEAQNTARKLDPND